MRKLLLTAVALCAIFTANAQEENETYTTKSAGVYAEFGSSHTVYGLYLESEAKEVLGLFGSTVLRGGYGTKTYDAVYTPTNEEADDGFGWNIELGSLYYFNETQKGFYWGNFLSYGSFKFDQDLSDGANFEGKYRYFSFFSPEIGFKFDVGNFVINPNLGAMWKIELKGKGDVDNNFTDVWSGKAGLSVRYIF